MSAEPRPDARSAAATRAAAATGGAGTAIRVLLVDDHDLVRRGIALVVDHERDMSVVAHARDGESGVAAAVDVRPDVVVMDLRMPGRCDGVEATRRIVATTDSRVLVLTTFDDEASLLPTLRAGASAFLLKVCEAETLVAAIRTVHRGQGLVAPEVTPAVLAHVSSFASGGAFEPRLVDDLTPRERSVLRLLARGLSNAEIARELWVSESTAKSHVSHILTKTRVRDRVQAVALAYESGLVRPGEVGGPTRG